MENIDTKTKNIGDIGEEFTAKYLIEHDYKIIARNYHSRYGEIDIIAENSQIIAFVEVKTRRENPLYSPRESVVKSKQKKIMQTAVLYLQKTCSPLQPRFDVAEVLLKNHVNELHCINYIQNAFMQEGNYAPF
ncbi:UPF0102 protein [Clostridia bacterium]|nr:UPF0102 protein [Clostridia bacterium]